MDEDTRIIERQTAATHESGRGSTPTAHRAVGMAQNNPLGVAIGAAALGFVVGSVLPETRLEDERLGPIASQVRDQVGDVASDAIEHGKQVAGDAAEAAQSAAKESGKEHAQQMRESAQETMRS